MMARVGEEVYFKSFVFVVEELHSVHIVFMTRFAKKAYFGSTT